MLLRRLFGEVIVTNAVAREAVGIALPEWVIIRDPTKLHPLPPKLGAGEVSAISLALEADRALVILDDLRARRVAAELSIEQTGVLGLLLSAKKATLLPSIGPLVAQLRTYGMRVSDQLIARVLREADEFDV